MILNGRSLRPRRSCRKNAGPGDSSFTTTAAKSTTGSEPAAPTSAMTTSTSRWTPPANALVPANTGPKMSHESDRCRIGTFPVRRLYIVGMSSITTPRALHSSSCFASSLVIELRSATMISCTPCFLTRALTSETVPRIAGPNTGAVMSSSA